MGTIPLVNYQIPSAPPENIVFAASPTKTSEKYYLSPTSNLYPELRNDYFHFLYDLIITVITAIAIINLVEQRSNVLTFFMIIS